VAGRSIAKLNAARRVVAAARRDLAAAKSVQKVTEIRNKAEGIRAYARAAKDRTLEIDAAEIHFRTTRRLGQMIAGQQATVGLAKGTAGMGRPKKGGSRKDPPKDVPTLADVGIDKHLAHGARMLAAPSEELFEKLIAEWRKQTETGNEPVTVNLLRAVRKAAKGDQLPLLDLSQFYLSGSGRKLERVRSENTLAPDWLKLGETSDKIIEIIADSIRKLKKLAARIARPDGAKKFQEEFGRMEARVTDQVAQYRLIRKLIAEMESAGIPVQPEPEPEYDTELERRGLWPPDGKKGDPDDGVPF
jgi:hypothetical protein